MCIKFKVVITTNLIRFIDLFQKYCNQSYISSDQC